MKRKSMWIWVQLLVFFSVFTGCVAISMIFASAQGYDSIRFIDIRNAAIYALFIAVTRFIWVGSEKSNKAYMVRTIIYFLVIFFGCAALMVWFEWIPAGPPLISFSVIFVAIYIVIWLIVTRQIKKQKQYMNEKLETYKKAEH